MVHELDWVPWLDELELPAPTCRQGYAGTGARGEIRPTRHPVSCRRCLRLGPDVDADSSLEQSALSVIDGQTPW